MILKAFMLMYYSVLSARNVMDVYFLLSKLLSKVKSLGLCLGFANSLGVASLYQPDHLHVGPVFIFTNRLGHN